MFIISTSSFLKYILWEQLNSIPNVTEDELFLMSVFHDVDSKKGIAYSYDHIQIATSLFLQRQNYGQQNLHHSLAVSFIHS